MGWDYEEWDLRKILEVGEEIDKEIEKFETVVEEVEKAAKEAEDMVEDKKEEEKKQKEEKKSKKSERKQKLKEIAERIKSNDLKLFFPQELDKLKAKYGIKDKYKPDEEVPEAIKGEIACTVKEYKGKKIRISEYPDGEVCAGFIDGESVFMTCTCKNFSHKNACIHTVDLWNHLLRNDYLESQKVPAISQTKPLPETTDTSTMSADSKLSLKEKLKGKLVILYGSPMVGKTTFAHQLAREYSACLYLKIDKNFRKGDYDVDNVVYHEINDPEQLLEIVKQLAPQKDTLVVLDSVTSLDAFFVSNPLVPSPRMDVARARFADAVIFHLQRLKENNTVLVIAHEKIADFKTEEIAPRMNAITMRHADIVMRAKIENGKHIIEVERIRKPKKQVNFEVRGL